MMMHMQAVEFLSKHLLLLLLIKRWTCSECICMTWKTLQTTFTTRISVTIT